MRGRTVSRIVVMLLVLAVFGLIAPLGVNADDGQMDSGDPVHELPGSKTLEPTPGSLGEVWMILMAMAFQLAL
jgi:TRAP-type C4-dicarboxylate transport system permease small subunit